MMKKIALVFIVGLVLTGLGCSSTDKNEDENLAELSEAADSDEAGDLGADQANGEEADPFSSDEDESDFEEDGGEDNLADDGDSEPSESGDDFGEDDFSEDEFASEQGGDEADDFELDDTDVDAADTDFVEPVEDLASDDIGDVSEDDPEMAFAEPELSDEESFGPSVKIENIRFLSNQSGGTVVVESTGPLSYQSRVNSETNQFVIEIENVELPERLKRPYFLKEFPDATFGAINAYQDVGSSTARVVIQMKTEGFVEPIIQAEGNSILVIPSSGDVTQAMNAEVPADLSPPSDEQAIEDIEASELDGAAELEAEEQSYDVAAATSDEKVLGEKSLDEFLTASSKFYGRPISIQVKDADIRDVLNFISGESGVNMIISEDVRGTISLKLREIPWDQALVTVMKSKGLGYVREGSVIRIATLQTLQNEAQEARRIIEAQRTLTPLKVRVIPVSYAVVSELAAQLTPFLTQGRGSVTFDERTSSLIVTDSTKVLDKVQRLVSELDVAPAQVMIEGKIVEAVETFSRSMGINWSTTGTNVQLSENGGVGDTPLNLNTSLSVANIPVQRAEGLPFVQGIEVGTLDVLGDLSASLALAEVDQLVNVVSSPRVVTMNRTPATITQNSEVVSIVTIVNQGISQRSVQRDPVLINLQVTPQITASGSVIMDLTVGREFAGPVVDAQTQARAISRRQTTTRILVKNGQTAVIGGMYNSQDLQSEEGTPWLKEIPVLGWLFKSRQVDREKNELIFFLTPRILNLQEQSPSLKRNAAKASG